MRTLFTICLLFSLGNATAQETTCKSQPEHEEILKQAQTNAEARGQSKVFVEKLITLFVIRNAIARGDASAEVLELIDSLSNPQIGGAEISLQLITDENYKSHVLRWLKKTLDARQSKPTDSAQGFEERLVQVISQIESM